MEPPARNPVSLADQLRPVQEIISICATNTEYAKILPGFSFSFHCIEVTVNAYTSTSQPITVIAGTGEKGKLKASAWMPIIAGRLGMRAGDKAIFKTKAVYEDLLETVLVLYYNSQYVQEYS